MRNDSIRSRVLMLFCSNAILQLMGFAYRAALSRLAGAEALGLNSLVMQVYRIVTAVCISGMNVAAAATAAKLDDKSMRPLLRAALRLYFAVFTCVAVPAAIFAKSIGRLALGDESTKAVLRLMLSCIFMTGIENLLKSIHMGKKLVSRCAASELIEQAVRFALVLILLKKLCGGSKTQTVFLIMLGMLASEFVSVTNLLISFLHTFKRSGNEKPVRAKMLAVIAFPAALTALSGTLFSSLGELSLPGLLVRAGAPREAALACIGEINTVYMPLVSFPVAFIGALASVIMPEISERASRGENANSLIKRAILCAAFACAVYMSAVQLFHNGISKAVFGRSISGALLLLLQIRSFFAFIGVVCVSSMNGLMMQKKVLITAAAGEAYQFALISLITPAVGIMGYAAASAAGELIRLLMGLVCIFQKRKNGVEIAVRM